MGLIRSESMECLHNVNHSCLPHSRLSRHRFFLGLLIVALTPFATGCVSSPDQPSAHKKPTTELQRLATQHRVCGVAVASVKQRQLHSVETASGCDAAHAVRSDSVFQAASLSKPVFAYAVLKLVEQGKLTLDTPIVQYLPQGYQHAYSPWKTGPSSESDWVTDPRLGAVTVRMALNHTAGLPNWASGPLHFKGTPGERWMYSGEGYVLLQRAVEAVTGLPLDEFMREQVFVPLRMEQSSYSWNPQIAQHLLPGSKANGTTRTTFLLKQPVSAFTLHTTAEDYGLFLAALLRDAPMVEAITTSPVGVDPTLDLSWGLGWGIERTPDDVRLWHWGNNPGYRAFVVASVRAGDGMVMLTNSEGGLQLAEPLAKAVLPGTHQVFRSAILGGGFMDFVCEALRLCL